MINLKMYLSSNIFIFVILLDQLNNMAFLVQKTTISIKKIINISTASLICAKIPIYLQKCFWRWYSRWNCTARKSTFSILLIFSLSFRLFEHVRNICVYCMRGCVCVSVSIICLHVTTMCIRINGAFFRAYTLPIDRFVPSHQYYRPLIYDIHNLKHMHICIVFFAPIVDFGFAYSDGDDYEDHDHDYNNISTIISS